MEPVLVEEAGLEGGVAIRNLYPLYLHDLSAFTEFYDVDARGLWFPDYLPDWLDRPLPVVHPMVIREGGRPAGFALVGERPFPHMTPGRDLRMCEFFVLNRLRRRGVGRRAAAAIFDRFRGLWEVSELPANARAIAFWRSVIAEYTGGRYAEGIERGDVVQVFDNGRPGADVRAPRATLLYQFMAPDDVVSARVFSDLAEGLAARGWQVEARPSNRAWDDRRGSFPRREARGGVDYRRVFRPPLPQARAQGRLLNAAWMIGAWSAIALAPEPPDVLVLGTDPVLAVLVARVVRRIRPSIKLAHWCFDVYPEAAIAEGMLPAGGLAARALERLIAPAYRACDLIADLGPCMRERLDAYAHAARSRRGAPPYPRAVTLTPWALVEPPTPVTPDPEARRELFGGAGLGLLYAGTFGRAHAHEAILDLARQLRGDDVGFCFGVRGNRAAALRAAVRDDDTNVRFAGFAPEAELERRLGAADVHLASLRQDWTGIVVPSKFFGSLSMGRPVVFAGSRQSSIARWIEEHRVGWVLDERSLPEVAADLRRIAKEPRALEAMQQRCHRVYRERFSRDAVIARWDEALRALVGSRA